MQRTIPGPWLAVVLLVAGCGRESHPLSGTVSFDGKPVADGYITFFPTAGTSRGTPIQSGQYELDVPPGEYRVLVTATPKVEGNTRPKLLPFDPIPPTAPGNNAAHTIVPGQTVLNIAIIRAKNP